MSTTIAANVRSMTGQGNASGETSVGTVTVELRTVNHRGFKCSIRSPETLAGNESRIESVVRRYLHRGSINLTINQSADATSGAARLNPSVLAAYIQQCRAAIDASGSGDHAGVIVNVAALTSLPGVMGGQRLSGDEAEQLWGQLEIVLVEALENLVEMRRREGRNMAESLLQDCSLIRRHVDAIEGLAPTAAENYRQRLEDKVKRVLAEHNVNLETVDVLREVQIYADKADVSEEITRLGSHLELFQSALMGSPPGDDHTVSREEATGRKLDFVIQEMFRETNTIGSKSADAKVSETVVEIKCAIERMRELVQNLE